MELRPGFLDARERIAVSFVDIGCGDSPIKLVASRCSCRNSGRGLLGPFWAAAQLERLRSDELESLLRGDLAFDDVLSRYDLPPVALVALIYRCGRQCQTGIGQHQSVAFAIFATLHAQ